MADTVEDIVEGAVEAVKDPVTLVTAAVAFYFQGPAAAYQVLAASAAAGAVTKATMPKPPSLQGLGADDLRGRGIQFRSPTATREVVYGLVKKSGPILHLEATNDNQDLHVIIALAGHEINSVEDVFFNDQAVRTLAMSHGALYDAQAGTTPDYSANAKLAAHVGLDDQVANTTLVSDTSFTTSHRLRGIAYLYAKLTFDEDVFATGVPNIQAVIKGKKLFDPRSDTTYWSDNPALAIRDYLTNTRYGLGATAAEIDDTAFIEAANVCDETVTINPENAPVVGINTEKRYTINGVVDTSKAPKAIIEDLLTACAGRLVYSNGKYKLIAGEFRTAVKTLDEDDLRGGITIQTKNSGQDQFNAVKGVFVSPDDNWQPADFPSITSSTFETEDNNERSFLDITLPFTTSVSMAQRLAKSALYRTREQLTLQLPCKLTAFELDVGDTVQITNTRLGFSAKTFEVVSWQYSFGEGGDILGVDLVVREISASAYEFDPDLDETIFSTNNTTLPNPADVPAPGLTVSDELRALNEEAISVLLCDVQGGSIFTTAFEVQAKKSTDTEWINLGRAAGNRFELINVEDSAVYQVRARSVTTFGYKSVFTTASHQVVGKTEPPSDVTGLTGNLIGNQYFLTWNAVPDRDLSYYRVRYAAPDGAPTYQNSISLVPKVSRPATSVFVPARNGTYFVKAVDKLGLASESPASIVLSSNISDLDNFTGVQTLTEHPDFNGTFDDVVEIDEDDRLVLDTSLAFDAAPGNFDDAAGLFDGGSGNVDGSGFYYFGNSADLGAVFLVRATANIKQIRVDYVNLFDDAAGLFDNREGAFEGDVNAFDNVDVIMECRITEDDPAGTPTWSDWKQFVVADFRARGLEFRAKLSTLDDQATPAVSELSVQLDMGIHVESGEDVVSGVGAKVITFDTPYKVTPAIGIGAQDLQTGDYYEITSKSRSGFTITFKNSGGTAVSRTFDYVAKGYGKEVS